MKKQDHIVISMMLIALNIIENSNHNNEIYNIGNNDEISILNLIKFEDILKIKISTSSVICLKVAL